MAAPEAVLRAMLYHPVMSRGLETYSFLWNGTQDGWVIQVTHVHLGLLTFTFGSGGPSIAEIVSLRALFPALASAPPRDVLHQLRGQSTYEIEGSGPEMREIGDRAKRLGLQVAWRSHGVTRRIPINTRTRMALLIEDAKLAESVCLHALEQGVPVAHIEVD